jgi:redox-sensitive bicupin YhaK (pirin superfamily)
MIILPEPIFEVQRAGTRASYDFGWLRTNHSFSFADYYDPRNVNWGALRVFNDDYVAPGKGFGTHPHRDMEILTYVLSGQLEHRDSLGSHGIVGPGGVQFMSAGTGVQHSEFNHSATEGLHFLQMWVLPGAYGGPPAYGQIEFDAADRSGKWLLIASGRAASGAPVQLTQDASFRVSRLAGETVQHTFAPGRLGFLFVASGAMSVAAFDRDDRPAGEEAALAGGDAVRLAGLSRMDVGGTGEVVLWDVPRPPDGAND